VSRRAGVRGLSVLQASENEQYERKTIMKKIMCAIVLGSVACAMTGCRSTDVDEWLSDLTHDIVELSAFRDETSKQGILLYLCYNTMTGKGKDIAYVF